MKKTSIIFFIFIFLYSNLAFSQSKLDTLQKKIEQLETQIKKVDNVPDKFEKESEKVNSNYNNIITNQGNYMAWASLLVTFFGFILGIVIIKSYIDANKAKREVESTLLEIKNNAEASLKSSQEVLDESKKNDAELKQKIISIKKQEEEMQTELMKISKDKDLLKEEINSIKSKANDFILEIDKRFKEEADKTLELIDLYNQAYEKMNLGSIKVATKLFKKILSFNDNHVGARCKLAMCYSSLDRNVLASEAISKYANNENEHSAIYSTFGVILRREGEYDKALNYFEKATLGEFKNNHTTYSHIGYTYLFKKNYLKSKEYFNKSLDLYNDNSPSTYGLLKISALENTTGVDNDLIKVAHINAERDINEHPKYPYPYFGLAFVEVLSNNPNSVNSIKEAIGLCKNMGIIKEQISEYNLFSSKANEFKHLKEVQKLLNDEFNRLSNLYRDAK